MRTIGRRVSRGCGLPSLRFESRWTVFTLTSVHCFQSGSWASTASPALADRTKPRTVARTFMRSPPSSGVLGKDPHQAYPGEIIGLLPGGRIERIAVQAGPGVERGSPQNSSVESQVLPGEVPVAVLSPLPRVAEH